MKQSNIFIINTVNQIQDCKDCEDCKDHNNCDDERDKSTTSESSTFHYISCDENHNNNIECSYKY